MNNLYYIRRSSSLEKAIGGQEDNIELKIMPTDENLTFEQFKTFCSHLD